VRFSCEKLDDSVELGVYDNGRGLQSGREPFPEISPGRDWDLRVMKERAELSGGDLHMNLPREKGTNIRASWRLC